MSKYIWFLSFITSILILTIYDLTSLEIFIFTVISIYLFYMFYKKTHPTFNFKSLKVLLKYKTKGEVLNFIKNNIGEILILHSFGIEQLKKDKYFIKLITKNKINLNILSIEELFIYYFDFIRSGTVINNNLIIKSFYNIIGIQELYNLIIDKKSLYGFIQLTAINSPYGIFFDWKYLLEDINGHFGIALNNKGIHFELSSLDLSNLESDLQLVLTSKNIDINIILKFNEYLNKNHDIDLQSLLNKINHYLKKENIIIIEFISGRDDYSFYVYDLDKYNILKEMYSDKLYNIIG